MNKILKLKLRPFNMQLLRERLHSNEMITYNEGFYCQDKVDMLTEIYLYLEKNGHFQKIEEMLNELAVDEFFDDELNPIENLTQGEFYFNYGSLHNEITDYIYYEVIEKIGIDNMDLSEPVKNKMHAEEEILPLLHSDIHDLTLCSFYIEGLTNIVSIKNRKKSPEERLLEAIRSIS